MRNARLEEAQAGIKIPKRNINNLRYANDTTLMAEHSALFIPKQNLASAFNQFMTPSCWQTHPVYVF